MFGRFHGCRLFAKEVGVPSRDLPESVVRFGEFTASLETGELHRNGVKIKLHGQPFEVLSVLLKHPGRLVAREELRSQLWPQDTFVDFEHGLNAAVNRLREALEDSAPSRASSRPFPAADIGFLQPSKLKIRRQLPPS